MDKSTTNKGTRHKNCGGVVTENRDLVYYVPDNNPENIPRRNTKHYRLMCHKCNRIVDLGDTFQDPNALVEPTNGLGNSPMGYR